MVTNSGRIIYKRFVLCTLLIISFGINHISLINSVNKVRTWPGCRAQALPARNTRTHAFTRIALAQGTLVQSAVGLGNHGANPSQVQVQRSWYPGFEICYYDGNRQTMGRDGGNDLRPESVGFVVCSRVRACRFGDLFFVCVRCGVFF